MQATPVLARGGLWRDRVFALALLTDIRTAAEVVRVSANKTSAQHNKFTPFICECIRHVSLRSITRGRARGPPPAPSQQSRPWPQVLGERTLPGRPDPRGRRSGSGAASGHQYQRGLRGRTGYERRRLVARVAANRQWTAVPSSAHAGSLQRGSSFHLIGHICRDLDRPSRSRRSPESETPCPSALTDIR